MVDQAKKITIPVGANVWPHEMRTAQALASAGYTVEFIRRSERDRNHSADAYLNGVKFEFKAPTGSAMKVVERNLKKARWQSADIVFDSRRMKNVPDAAIQRELSKWLHEFKEIHRVLFVNRHGIVITDVPDDHL
jgi:hypothetical protein